MRISGGEFCGRKLKVPPGEKVRPTQDRVREALFSMLMSVVPDARFIDLFAGSGSVGLEAYSRGARSVTWVEKDPRHASVLKENRAVLAPDLGEVACCEVTRWLKGPGCGRQADVAFADPPYAAGREQGFAEIMRLLAENRVLRPGGIFVAEMPEAKSAEEVAGWTLLRDRTYGHTRLAVYKLETERLTSEAGGPKTEAGE
ncbi:MAG TPA: 16S rRNA (guanine(966)-N(2))-methyltransferase RsmD [Kiritimatiellia bacterium]|nr:16S rRNA (guanine(966)-N(2))-methyltransferase RsmD [Kiritimatiellia bacterium]HPS08837.1 16S rRNA (guanine(966)-N(2))-methyltransferase RsmD [Kiritimatiellia bacterium]